MVARQIIVYEVIECKKHALFFKEQRSEGAVGASIEWDAGTEVCQGQTSCHGLLHYLIYNAQNSENWKNTSFHQTQNMYIYIYSCKMKFYLIYNAHNSENWQILPFIKQKNIYMYIFSSK